MVGLYSIKPWFVGRLRRVEDALVARSVSPDALTAAAVVVSCAAGGLIAAGGITGRPLLWLAVPPLLLARLALNALDGSVARRCGSDRPFGIALNEAGDRVADAATLGGAAFAVRSELALGAIAASLFASILGVVALAVTGRRDSGGPMGKADRAAAVAVGAALGAVTRSSLPLTVALWVIIGGSLVTAVLRTVRLRAAAAGESSLRWIAWAESRRRRSQEVLRDLVG